MAFRDISFREWSVRSVVFLVYTLLCVASWSTDSWGVVPNWGSVTVLGVLGRCKNITVCNANANSSEAARFHNSIFSTLQMPPLHSAALGACPLPAITVSHARQVGLYTVLRPSQLLQRSSRRPVAARDDWTVHSTRYIAATATLFVLGLVILCLVYIPFVIVWLSVPVTATAWKDCLRNDLLCVDWRPCTLHTHSLTYIAATTTGHLPVTARYSEVSIFRRFDCMFKYYDIWLKILTIY